MRAESLTIRHLFVQDRRYLVPLFQRPYVWEEERQWQPLWEDITKVADRRREGQSAKPHFLGAVVLDQIRTPSASFEARQVIDGQQRLTTLQILLAALRDLAKQLGASDLERSFDRLTKNEDPMNKDPDATFKVWPTNVDRQQFSDVMIAGSPEAVRSLCGSDGYGDRIAKAYLYFVRIVESWLGPGTSEEKVRALHTLFETVIGLLQVVVIDLDDSDNAQVIFESLNARGTPLLPADLVKNYLFLAAEAQGEQIDTLYKTHWASFDTERKFWRVQIGQGRSRRPRLDLFFQHYLTLSTEDEVPSDYLYATFKEHAGPKPDAASHLKSLRDYSLIYRSFSDQEPGSRERLFFERLSTMDTTTVDPLLLELFRRLETGASRQELRRILVDIESFLVRRMVCQLSVKSYGRLFLDLLKNLKEKSFTSDSVRSFLMKQEAESNRWPSDKEFQDAWLSVPVYRVLVRKRVRMLLEALNQGLHHDKTETLTFSKKLTVEHLLPQAWESYWPLSQDEDESETRGQRDRLVHTLGNLTLLTQSLNPSVSNGTWTKKRAAILKHSALNLNRPLEDYDEWDEEAIRHRGNALFKVAKKIWPRPTSTS